MIKRSQPGSRKKKNKKLNQGRKKSNGGERNGRNVVEIKLTEEWV